MGNLDSLMTIILQGILIGIVVSAPMGPVGVLCIQRTINKGRWYGFITGLGATVSDIIYAVLTGYGMSMVIDVIDKNLFYLQLFGSILLLAFGVFTFVSNPTRALRPAKQNKGSYMRNFITALLVTLSNPLIIFLFITLFARFSFVTVFNNATYSIVGFLSIALGAIIWWFGLSYSIHRVSSHFNPRGIWVMNRVIGTIVSIVAIGGIVLTLSGGSIY